MKHLILTLFLVSCGDDFIINADVDTETPLTEEEVKEETEKEMRDNPIRTVQETDCLDMDTICIGDSYAKTIKVLGKPSRVSKTYNSAFTAYWKEYTTHLDVCTPQSNSNYDSAVDDRVYTCRIYFKNGNIINIRDVEAKYIDYNSFIEE